MKQAIAILFVLLFLQACKNNPTAIDRIVLDNESFSIAVDPFGGAVSEMFLKEDSLNFLSWKLSQDQMPANNSEGAAFKGHFLCYGRWGAPTEGEIEAGIPHNGHHNNLLWEWNVSGGGKKLSMEVRSEKEKFLISRSIQLDEHQPLFHFTERFIHTAAIGRLCNIVQHITLGPPFLNPESRFFSNCSRGFLQVNSYPDPSESEYLWPEAKDPEGNSFDLTHFQTDRNFVSTHIFDEPKGWVIAIDPLSASYLGYIWDSEHYPWINFWNHNQDNSPAAFGMEFGTTGVGRPYPELVAADASFHQRRSFFFLDAGEEVKKEFTGFSGKLKSGYTEVESIKIDSFITIIFKNESLNERYSDKYDIRSLIGN